MAFDFDHTSECYWKRPVRPRLSPRPEFKKADLDARQELYCGLAEEIWNPARLEQELK